MAPGKPLPLKQRTSSVDPRRDYTVQTWVSVLALLKPREYVITVDHFSIWRRHLAWAVENGKDLRDYMTQRYASSMVFMSLLLSTELNVLFNSAGVTTAMRHALQQEDYCSISFWAGMAIMISAILTLLSLISTFTAWTMVSAVSEANAHCIFRSSIGQYVAELPGRFIVGSIYSFLVWICLFFFLLLPMGLWSGLLLLLVVCLFVHTITAFSAFGRVIMHTGAMGSTRIFDKAYEASLLPHSLHNNLLIKAKANLGNKTSIMRQYQCKSKPIARLYSEDEMSGHLSDRSALSNTITPDATPVRQRTESLVKFADGFDTNGERFNTDMKTTPRNQVITVPKDAKTNLSVLTPESSCLLTSTTTTTSRRPPRPQLARKESDTQDATTPLVKNNQQEAAAMPFGIAPCGFAERWISSSSTAGSDTDDPDEVRYPPDALLATDKDGNTTRVSMDNPYLLHMDPTPFVPTLRRQHPTVNDGSQQHDTRSISVSSDDRLNYEMTEDELHFDDHYGDLFEAEDYVAKSSGENKETSRTTSAEQEPGIQNGSYHSSSEWTRLVDDNKLEQGDYYSMHNLEDRTGKPN